ncbi:MAG TPA: hypothetical protein PLC52_08160 [Anaerolineales bacterium]|nr:hypothetical protein [Anaerolineales bacterium]HRQ92823.1 hypothetical protein [Anaerolineales bacterium]
MRNKSFVQAHNQTPWRRQMQTIGVVVVAIVSLGLLAILYLNVTARTATMGRSVQSLQNERIRLQQQIESLESQLASLTSNESMQARATASGFVPMQPSAITYLTVEGYRGRTVVELAPRAGLQFTGVVRLPDAYTKSLFDWVGELFDQYGFGLLGGY